MTRAVLVLRLQATASWAARAAALMCCLAWCRAQALLAAKVALASRAKGVWALRAGAAWMRWRATAGKAWPGAWQQLASSHTATATSRSPSRRCTHSPSFVWGQSCCSPPTKRLGYVSCCACSTSRTCVEM
ncbi:hypothetical protein DUNSADRAFT_10392 [Dunaliella salina]|uniref:Secreted protein n=1 Tax=Dunaliella salina TaxID=3046 RepID=A0ABQ7GFH1_DUNSA|nr:hypothetical protein DUNSADRAFT_10392 [Dunaliella salina]|eukprot:KAF5833351.1 hypothetical protein DUNSADRAFT_10392 [Dunaliella salina]